MLGIMEDPPMSPDPHVAEADESQERILKTSRTHSKNGTITDFFKSPTKPASTPLNKPANLLGYFSSQKSPSSDGQKREVKQIDSKKTEEAPKTTANTAGDLANPQSESKKKAVRAKEGKKQSKQLKQNEPQQERDAKQTAAHLEGLISQLNRGRTDRGNGTSGKRKKAASPNASSADDFESPPPTQKTKRPKVEQAKQGRVAKKVFSLSDDKDESQVEAQYDLASRIGDDSNTKKDQDESKTGSSQQDNGVKDSGVGRTSNGGNSRSKGCSDASNQSKLSGHHQKKGGTILAKNSDSVSGNNVRLRGSQYDKGAGKDGKIDKVEVISYEDFLNSEMDDYGGGISDEGVNEASEKESRTEDARKNLMLLTEENEEEDSILLISPDRDEDQDRVRKEGKLEACGASNDDEEKTTYSGEYDSHPLIEGVAPLNDDEKSENGGKIEKSKDVTLGPRSDEQNDLVVENRRLDGSRSEMEQDVCNASAEESEDSAAEISTPAKSGQVVSLQQTPKMVVKAMVHSPQSGSSQRRLSPTRKKTPVTPQGRISNVALDDADNAMSVIEVVRAPTKPLYSIFVKKPKGGNKKGEGSKKGEKGGDTAKKGDSADDFEEEPTGKASPRKSRRDEKRKKSKKMDSKAASGREQKTSPRKRGRPRKIVTDEVEGELDQKEEKTATDSKKASGKCDGQSSKHCAEKKLSPRKRGRPKKVVTEAKEHKSHPKERKIITDQSKGKDRMPKKAVASSEDDSGPGRRALRPRRSASKETSLEQGEESTEDAEADQNEEDKESTASKQAKVGARRRSGDRIQTKNSTKSVRAQQLLRKAKSQKAQVLGRRSLDKTGKLRLRVTLDPLDLSGRGRKVIGKTSVAEAGDSKSLGVDARNEKKTATVTKKEAPVKLAAMFTKEGRRSLAKQQQQEAESNIEVHTLSSSSDDECSRDALPACVVSTPRKFQATAGKEVEELMAPFPEISHILQKEVASGDNESDWWNLPVIDQSKLRIKNVDQSQATPLLVTDPSAPLKGLTQSHLEERVIQQIKFTGHPELSYEEQKAALDKVSESNPQFPVRRIFKRYLAMRKGETPEPAKNKDDKPKLKEDAKPTSRKRKPEGDPEVMEQKVRRSSRGRFVKEQKSTAETKGASQNAEKEGKNPADDISKLRDLLWSDKYQPTCFEEVLVGNRSSVNHLKTWLKEWKIRIGRIKKKEAKAMRGNNKSAQPAEDSESDFELSDDESDSEDDDDSLCNTFLITGQHGVGKTSAVYACAKEMGFKVIEVNASSKRVGRQILDDLGEATQSHQLTGQAGLKTADLARFFKLKTPPALVKPKAPPKPKMHRAFAAFVKKNVDVQDQKTTSKGKPSPKKTALTVQPGKARATPKKAPQAAANTPRRSSQAPLMPGPDRSNKGASVILFDEVDIVFEEDKGFLNAINTFMASTKRPIILTTSDARFSDCLEGRFEHVKMQGPEMKKLATSMQLLCLAENVRTSQQDMLNLVSYCGSDLRRCLHSLQAWVNTGAMLSSWKQAGAASPSRKIRKLSLKRMKGSNDYSCLMKQDQKQEMIQQASPMMHQGSVLSLVGCQSNAEMNTILSNGRLSEEAITDVYASTRELLHCGTGTVRRLERRMLDRIIPDLLESGEDCESVSFEHPPGIRDDGDEQLGTKMKHLHGKSVDELSLYLDNLSEIDLFGSKSDSLMGVDGGDKNQWWCSNTYAGLDDVSDDHTSDWSLRDFSEEVKSVLEWENFSLCRQRLTKLRDTFEGTGTYDGGAVGSLDVGEELKLDPDPSYDINTLYGAISRKLPRYAWCSHRSTSLEFLPMMRSVCHSERSREGAQKKRRFLHYFDAISFNLKPMEKIRLASIASHFTWREDGDLKEEQTLPLDEDSNMGI